ncbi:MAG: peptidoglycan DD-metalloendopeptidase family protein [Lachnospiraceae bacterium]|nr:peptidoglycan DD-metalloendopeptidase family protein [Lachnospiraceae bacterium]
MFYKEKGFYISLLCGVVALVAFAAICVNLLGRDDGDEEAPIAVQESPSPAPTATPEAKEASTNKAKSEVKPEKKTATPKPTKKAAKTNTKPVENALHFDQETGLLWPVEGDVLMEYSADRVIYFETLAQYRTNPALIIAAQVGDEVKASADGIVQDITTSEETGRTLTMSIGDDFTVSYGQLKEIAVQKGDAVSEGQVIGKIADPTKYYSLEGANLFYQVKEKEESVNPMVLLR